MIFHPQCKKRTKETRLIVTEGEEDFCFLTCVKELYWSRDFDFTVVVDHGFGKPARETIKIAVDKSGFAKKFVILDEDTLKDEDEIYAKNNNITLIDIKPCMEALLLAILENSTYDRETSKKCKHFFEKSYIGRKRRTQVREYHKKFNKPLLEQKRRLLLKLDTILHIFE